MARGSQAAMELMVELDDRASKGLKQIGAESKGLGGILKGVGLGIGASIIPAIGGLGGALMKAGKAAAEEEAGQRRLYTTLKNSVPGWDQNTQAIEQYISKQQKLAFADDELRNSLNFLVGQTGDLTEATNLQATAMDLARAKGISLEAATKAVGKVDQESIGILKRLGIQVTDQMTKEEALTAIRQVSAGQAQEYASSAAGAMERVQNAFGDTVEDIGVVILPKLTEALGGIADFISGPEFKQGFEFATELIGNGLSGAFQLIGDTAKTVGPIVGGLVSVFQGGNLEAFKTSLDVLPQPIQFIGDALGGIVGKAGEFFRAFQTGDPQAIKDVFNTLPGPIGLVGGALVDASINAGKFFGALLSGDIEGARNVIESLPGPIGLVGSGLFDASVNVGKLFGAILGGDAEAVKAVFTDIGGPVGALGIALTNATTEANKFFEATNTQDPAKAIENMNGMEMKTQAMAAGFVVAKNNLASFFEQFMGEGANTGALYWDNQTHSMQRHQTETDKFWKATKESFDKSVADWNKFWADTKTSFDLTFGPGSGWATFWSEEKTRREENSTHWTNFWTGAKEGFDKTFGPASGWAAFWDNDKAKREANLAHWEKFWTDAGIGFDKTFGPGSGWGTFWENDKAKKEENQQRWDKFWIDADAGFNKTFGAGSGWADFWADQAAKGGIRKQAEDEFWATAGKGLDNMKSGWNTFWSDFNAASAKGKAGIEAITTAGTTIGGKVISAIRAGIEAAWGGLVSWFQGKINSLLGMSPQPGGGGGANSPIAGKGMLGLLGGGLVPDKLAGGGVLDDGGGGGNADLEKRAGDFIGKPIVNGTIGYINAHWKDDVVTPFGGRLDELIDVIKGKDGSFTVSGEGNFYAYKDGLIAEKNWGILPGTIAGQEDKLLDELRKGISKFAKYGEDARDAWFASLSDEQKWLIERQDLYTKMYDTGAQMALETANGYEGSARQVNDQFAKYGEDMANYQHGAWQSTMEQKDWSWEPYTGGGYTQPNDLPPNPGGGSGGDGQPMSMSGGMGHGGIPRPIPRPGRPERESEGGRGRPSISFGDIVVNPLPGQNGRDIAREIADELEKLIATNVHIRGLVPS